MIKCSCCGNDISEEAKVCPHCGQPTEYKKSSDANTFNGVTNILSWIIVLVIACAIGL